MKILLQDQKTRRYLTEGDHWSEDASAARLFMDLGEARRFGGRANVRSLRIVALAGVEAGGKTGAAGKKEES